MTHKTRWGLVILIVLLLGISVVLLMRNTDTEPIKVYKTDVEPTYKSSEKLQDTKKFKEWWEEQGAKHLPDDGAQSVEVSDEQNTDEFPDFASLTPEQLKKIYDQFYIERGLKPPPPGYKYRWAAIDVPLLDENGQPVLHKIGDPIINIAIEVGFAPTKEEYEQLNQLKRDKLQAEFRGWVEQAASITQKIEKLEALVQRERPVLKGTMWIGNSGEYNRERVRRMAREQLNEALRSYGLEHLIAESQLRFR